MRDRANTTTFPEALRLMAAALVLLVMLLAIPASAHKEHQQNQTQDEMTVEQPAPIHGNSPALHSKSDSLDQESFDIADFLGRLHPAAVHFPIALLIVAALAELALMVRPTLGLDKTVGFLLWAGALTGAGAVLLGWFAGGFRLTDRSDVLFWHRWNGTAIAMVALVAALAHSRKWNSAFVRLLVFSVAIALIIQGYLGGELAFGPDHLNLIPKGGF